MRKQKQESSTTPRKHFLYDPEINETDNEAQIRIINNNNSEREQNFLYYTKKDILNLKQLIALML